LPRYPLPQSLKHSKMPVDWAFKALSQLRNLV